MQILTINGSARLDSSNAKLLKALPSLLPSANFLHYNRLAQLPLFTADNDIEQVVKNWQNAVLASDAIIICTPEYIHNMPALLKNALEWLTTSGEFYQKRVLAITFTPHEPRGAKAMQSLLWSLQALEANIIGQLSLYANEIMFEKNKLIAEKEVVEMLSETLKIFET